MDTSESIQIIRKLADGINPYTGKKLKDVSPYQHPDTVRALYAAIRAFEDIQKLQSSRSGNAGNPWSKSEEQQLIDAHEAGKSIGQLAKIHQRSKGAIQSRLDKLGILEK